MEIIFGGFLPLTLGYLLLNDHPQIYNAVENTHLCFSAQIAKLHFSFTKAILKGV